MRVELDLPVYAERLFLPSRFKCLYGGRGGGKTQTFAAMVLLRILQSDRPLRVCCVREVQKSIRDSTKQETDAAIARFGLPGVFSVQRDRVFGPLGSEIFFRGMSTSTEESIKGLADVDILWFDEAQRMSFRSRELLYPTIRKAGSEIWLSFNPQSRADPVYRDFCRGGSRAESAVSLKVNYYDNRFFPAELEEERLICLADEPDRYPHIWLGEPDDEGEARKLLPYSLLNHALDAWDRKAERCVAQQGQVFIGLDVADTGAARNALVVRRGGVVASVERWQAGTLGETARRADAVARRESALYVHYDAGGVGAGVRSFLTEMGPRGYVADPVNFGSSPAGAQNRYSSRILNGDFFQRRNAQLGWALRLRLQRTQRMLAGERVDPAACLFIDSAMPRVDDYLAELTQPEWTESPTGKIVVNKMPDDGPSPDRYDATALAFAHDSQRGLRERR